MNSIFDIDFIAELIKKLDMQNISYLEHDYLQKILAACILIQKFNKARHEKTESFIYNHYNWLVKNYNNNKLSQKTKTEYYLFKVEIEKYFQFFGLQYHQGSPTTLTRLVTKPETQYVSSFSQLQALARIWGYSITRQEKDILQFLAFFIENIYGIPSSISNEIFNLLHMNWRPILAPIGIIPYKKFSLEEIQEYFFGDTNKQEYELHILTNADRLFSLTSPQFKNYLFIPKQDNFDIFEAALVIHEFQHIQDSYKQAKNNAASSLFEHTQEENLFHSEKNALNAERVFLKVAGAGKKGTFCWLESNLFYPFLLLRWELDIILSDTYDTNNFHSICRQHNMEPLSLSPLFDWRAPFQMSAYCAAVMDLEPNWKSYLCAN